MSKRSVWKGPFVDSSLLKVAREVLASGKDEVRRVVKTWSRRSTIIPEFVGLTLMVHNGRSFVPVSVSEEMVGHKLGEFSPTRSFRGHGANRKADRK